MNYPKYVKTILFAIIKEMAEQPQLFAKKPNADFTRKRKLDFESLMHFIISMESGNIKQELLKFFDFDLGTPSNTAFLKQRLKLLAEAFKFLLYEFNKQFPIPKYRERYYLLAADGCESNIARNPDDPDSFHPSNGKSQRGFNMLHSTALYDLIGKRYLDLVTQPGRKKNEYGALCGLIDRYQYGGTPIIIADRGFSSYNVYAHAIEKGIFFLIRTKDLNTKRLLSIDMLPDFIDTQTDVIITRTLSRKKRKHPELNERYKYIDKATSFDFASHGSTDEYHMHLRVVRIEVAEGTFENIVTNLPLEEFTAEDIKYLYRLRWGIETSFRDLKHTIGMTRFLSKKTECIEQEIWARLILFNFCSIITANVVIKQKDTKHVYQVNFSMAIKICHHFIRLDKKARPPDIEGLIGSSTLPIRQGRSYERKHRFQVPASFCYR